MPVLGLDLAVPDPVRAHRLFVDLLGGVEVDRGEPGVGDPRASAVQPGGATIAWSGVADRTSTLSVLTLGVPDPDHAAAGLPARGAALRPHGDGWTFRAAPLGVDVRVVPHDPGPGHPPVPGHRGHGAAGTRVLDHACFAVDSLADAVDLLRTTLGGEVVFGGHNRELGTLSSQVRFGEGTKVELLQPTRPDAELRRFLDRRGPGLHHLTWHVHDVTAAARAAEDTGFAVVGTDLERRTHWRETYLRPGSALGLLVQLAWTDVTHDEALDDDAVAAILAGRVDSWGYTMRPPAPPG